MKSITTLLRSLAATYVEQRSLSSRILEHFYDQAYHGSG